MPHLNIQTFYNLISKVSLPAAVVVVDSEGLVATVRGMQGLLLLLAVRVRRGNVQRRSGWHSVESVGATGSKNQVVQEEIDDGNGTGRDG